MRSHRLSRFLPYVGLLLLVVLSAAESPYRVPGAVVPVAAQAAQPCTDGYRQFPGPQDNNSELTPDQKIAAFADVLGSSPSPAISYGQYPFGLNQNNIPPGQIPPVVMKAMAGVESNWLQYSGGRTTYGNETCDYGLMQINASNRPDLFALTPSVLNSTRGNIAAGATVLAGSWNNGTNGPSPLVNDKDPEHLLNWYYAIGGYNGAPGNSSWNNNPNCGTRLICGGPNNLITYAPSRPWRKLSDPDYAATVDWSSTAQGSFPYQERILYNLQYPRYPNQTTRKLWGVTGLHLDATTRRAESGILPDDNLFLKQQSNGTETNYTPNILLFRHRGIIVQSSAPQTLRFEYELPVAATVTIEIGQLQNNGTLNVFLQANPSGNAGWNRYTTATSMNLNGMVYRIRAVVGAPTTIATYYIGQYVQPFVVESMQPGLASINANARTFLPLLGSQTTFEAGTNLLWNSSFNQAQPDNPRQPDYWDVQSIYGADVDPNVQVGLVGAPFTPSRALEIRAAPGGRVELSQRYTPPSSRMYALRFTIATQNGSTTTTKLTVRGRPVNGTSWTLIDTIDTSLNTEVTYTKNIQLDQGALVSFLVEFDPTNTSTVVQFKNIELTPVALTTTLAQRNSARTPTDAYPGPGTPTPTPNPYPGPPTPTPVGTPFPATTLLDTFNRSDGVLGSPWAGDVGGYTIRTNQVQVLGGGAVYYDQVLGANQEVYVTLPALNSSAAEIDLLLKGQGTGQCEVLEVWYIPSANTVQVVTCENDVWNQHGDSLALTLQAGDRFGARALADGTVNIYRNNSMVGSVQVDSSWSHRTSSGRVGVWFINAPDSILDDFGGGTLP